MTSEGHKNSMKSVSQRLPEESHIGRLWTKDRWSMLSRLSEVSYRS